jgi:hypothetical protein
VRGLPLDAIESELPLQEMGYKGTILCHWPPSAASKLLEHPFRLHQTTNFDLSVNCSQRLRKERPTSARAKNRRARPCWHPWSCLALPWPRCPLLHLRRARHWEATLDAGGMHPTTMLGEEGGENKKRNMKKVTDCHVGPTWNSSFVKPTMVKMENFRT